MLAQCQAGAELELSQSQGEEASERVLQEVLQFMRQHGGAWQARHGEADTLRKKFDRVRVRSTDPQRPLSARTLQLLAECEATDPSQSQGEEASEQVLQEFLQFMRQHGGAWRLATAKQTHYAKSLIGCARGRQMRSALSLHERCSF